MAQLRDDSRRGNPQADVARTDGELAPRADAAAQSGEQSSTSGTPAQPHRTTRSRVRERWRSMSLKSSFALHAFAFLVSALVLSGITSSLFGALESAVRADSYETSGLYLYDAEADTLVSAQSVLVIDGEGTDLFMGSTTLTADAIPLDEFVESNALIEDVSDYPDVSEYEAPDEDATRVDGRFAEPAKNTIIDPATLAAYDARARAVFATWIGAHPESALAEYFAGTDTDGAPDADGANGAGDGDDAPGDGNAGNASADDGANNSPLIDATAATVDTRDAASTLGITPVGYYVSTPPSPEARALSTLLNVLAVLMFPLWFGVCALMAGRRFYRTRIAPGLAVLEGAAENIADQNLDFTVSYDRRNEIGRLAASFETMRASLASSQRELWRTAEERRRLNAAFAHDLRTPLTVLKGKLELLDAHLQAGDATPEQLAASTDALARQVDRIERYVGAMSGLQKLEDRTPAREETSLDALADDLRELGNDLCDAHNAQANKPQREDASRDIAFALVVDAGTDGESARTVTLDRAFVIEVAQNLIANAMRYASSQVTAYLSVVGSTLRLAVEDDGAGFTPEALKKAQSPFFSEAPSENHFGIGLNIATSLCKKHGGALTLANRPAGGACVTATFSLEQAAVDSR